MSPIISALVPSLKSKTVKIKSPQNVASLILRLARRFEFLKMIEPTPKQKEPSSHSGSVV